MSQGPRGRTAVAAVLVAALGLTACTTSATGPAASAPTVTPSPHGETPEAPLVALAEDAVVVLDRHTGEEERRHPVEPGAGLEDLDLVDTRDVALVTRRSDHERAEVVEVSLADGATRVLVEGSRPAATNDGSRLAFVRRVGATDRLELVVATYDGTEESTWPAHEAGHESLELESLAWDPSGRRLVFALRSATGHEVRVLPVDRGGSLRSASHEVTPPSAGARLAAPTFRTPRVVTVGEGCCVHDGFAHWRVLDVALDVGSSTEVAKGLEDPVSHLDWSADQRHLAVTLDHPAATVVGWGPEGREELVSGLTSAEW